LGQTISEPGCNQSASRIDVAASHPQLKQIMAIAMTARVTGQLIVGAVNGCDPQSGNPTFDTGYTSYVYLQDG
jgi:hypothetical protein